MPRVSKYTEEDLLQAIQAVHDGVSQKEAARRHGIPRSTLLGRLRGAGTRQEAHSMQMSLSPDQERSLSEWCRIQDALGLPPTQNQVRLTAQRMLEVSGSNIELGKRWIEGFLRRNPSIKAKKGIRIEKARAEAVTPDKIKAFFAILDEPLVQSIRPQNRWNIDETGVMDGQERSCKVVGSSETKVSQVKTQQRSDWRSILECVNAEGNSLPPTIVLQGKNVQQQWIPDDEEGQNKMAPWQFVTSESGYSSNIISLEWLQKVFLPLTATGWRDWRLLCVDGHRSHVTDDFLALCASNKVWLATLPSHSTHAMQPLDVSVFASLKQHYRRYVDRLALISNADTISKEDFLLCYHKARKEALTTRIIRSGWRKSGLWPVDITIVLSNPRLLQPAAEAVASVAKEPEKQRDERHDEPDIFKTPARGIQVRKAALAIRKGGRLGERDQQLVLRKLSKALDIKNAQIAELDRQVKSLQQLNRRLKPKRRAKVVADGPNERFVNMEQIKKVKAKLAQKQPKNNPELEVITTFDQIMG
jgi:transposase-like protein